MTEPNRVVQVQPAPVTYHAIQNVAGAEKAVKEFLREHAGKNCKVSAVFERQKPVVEIPVNGLEEIPVFHLGQRRPSPTSPAWMDGNRPVFLVHAGYWLVHSVVNGLEVHTPESYQARFQDVEHP